MEWFEQLLSSLLNENKPTESPSKSKEADEFDSTKTSASDVEAACQQIVDYLVQNILGLLVFVSY